MVHEPTAEVSVVNSGQTDGLVGLVGLVRKKRRPHRGGRRQTAYSRPLDRRANIRTSLPLSLIDPIERSAKGRPLTQIPSHTHTDDRLSRISRKELTTGSVREREKLSSFYVYVFFFFND